MQWHQPVMNAGEKPNNFSWWVYLIVIIISFLTYFTVMLTSNSMSYLNSFSHLMINLGIAPLIMSCASAAFMFSYYFYQRLEYQFRKQFIESKKNSWLKWVSQHLIVINSSYITSNENSGLRIMGLNGNAQTNSMRVLTFEQATHLQNSSLNSILEVILSPLIDDIKKADSSLIFDVFSTHPIKLTEQALKIFCQKNNLMVDVNKQINILDSQPELSLINEWIDSAPAMRVLIVLSLHYKENRVASEFASALFFASPEGRKNSNYPRIYRLLETDTSVVGNDFQVLLNSEQIDKNRIRHIWGGNFSEPVLNTLITETIENSLIMDMQNIHRIEIYEGVIGNLHGWLSISFAHEAIRHGQKAQIVGQQVDDKIYFVQMEQKNSPNNVNSFKMTNRYPFCYLMATLFFLLALCFLPNDDEIRKQLLFILIGGGFFFALFLFLSIPFRLKLLTKKLEKEWQIAGRSNG